MLPPSAGPSSASLSYANATLAGARLLKRVLRDRVRTIWAADLGGKPVSVTIFHADTRAEQEADTFRAAAARLQQLKLRGVQRVRAIADDGLAFVSDLHTTGSLADVAALHWTLEQRLNFVRTLCFTLEALHTEGIVHGCLRPENVQLDDELKPIVCDAGLFDVALSFDGDPENLDGYGAYASPEARFGLAMTPSADIFSVGRLLHHLLIDDVPSEDTSLPPRLDALAPKAPAGLVRIVRKCTHPDAELRYATIEQLFGDLSRWKSWEAVGLAHPEVDDSNRTDDLAVPVVEAAPAEAPRPKPKKKKKKKPGEKAAKVEEDDDQGLLKREFSVDLHGVDRWVAVTAGTLTAILTPLYVYRTAADYGVPELMAAVGTALFTLALPAPTPSNPRFGRWLLLLIGFVGSYAINPSGRMRNIALARIREAQREQIPLSTLREQVLAGRRSFVDIDMRGANLSGLDFQDSTIISCDMQNANLASTNLSDARVLMTNMTGTLLSGANLTNLVGSQIFNLERASCDASSRLPGGWACAEGHPQLIAEETDLRQVRLAGPGVTLDLPPTTGRSPDAPRMAADPYRSTRGGRARPAGAAPPPRAPGAPPAPPPAARPAGPAPGLPGGGGAAESSEMRGGQQGAQGAGSRSR